jgi:hypothetical protein
MSENQRDKADTKRATARRIALLGAGATTLAVFNMMTNGAEAPSSAVVMLQYAALIAGLFALIGGLIMIATAAKV